MLLNRYQYNQEMTKAEYEMMKSGEEEKVRHILTEPKYAAVKAMLEKDHAIDCLLLLHMGRGKWKEAKDFMRENGLTLSDGTFRARMIEIEELGLAKGERIDPLKKYYVKTPLGEKTAKLLLEFFDKLGL
jgi:DNA-binding HxlR family transcriptional regulator